MGENCREQATGPSSNSGKENADNECGEKAAWTLIQMRERKEDRGPQDPNNDAIGGPILQHALREAAIDKLFAKRDGGGKYKENSAFGIILRENLQCQLRDGVASFVRTSGEAAEANELIGENEQAENYGNERDEFKIRNSQSELRCSYVMRPRPPENYADGDPLKENRGGVENQAVALFRLG